MTQSLLNGWLDVPDDFPKMPYEAVAMKMQPGSNQHLVGWKQHIVAWIAVAYRFRTCDDHSNAFAEAFRASKVNADAHRVSAALAISNVDDC